MISWVRSWLFTNTLVPAGETSSQKTMEEELDPFLKERKITSSIFTGRDDAMQKLDDVFERRKPGSHPRRDFLLWGVGGIGKTQIALRFIDCFAERYVLDSFSHVLTISHELSTLTVAKIRQDSLD